MREQWKTIEGYNYQVSSKGRIRNKTTKVVKKTFINERGYVVVSLYKEKKLKTFRVHRLVASAFIENPNNNPEINHKDEDKTNNQLTNLEWCTREYNLAYGTRGLRQSQTMKETKFCLLLNGKVTNFKKKVSFIKN